MENLQNVNKIGLKVSFTELVYAVVIGNSFGALSSSTSSLRLTMFFFALIVILDDWVLYHLSVDRISRTIKNYLLCFLLDIVVLITWYLLSVVPEEQLLKFLILASIFYSITTIWEIAFEKFSFIGLIKNTDIILSIIFLVIALIFYIFHWNEFLIIGLCYFFFIIFRLKIWLNLLKEQNLKL